MVNLNLLVNQFFTENEYDKLASKMVVVRNDGINVYSNIENSFETSSIGALVSGVWQAASSLSSMTRDQAEQDEFRLSFDTSLNGLHILPLRILGEIYFICAIFSEEENPAKLKRYIRLLRDNLEVYLSELSYDDNQNREGYLFTNISDSEMDNLFSFGGV